MGLENVTRPLDSSACALPDCEPIPHPNDEVTGHTSESEDDEYDILLREQEDESENCLQDSTVTLDLPNKHVSTCQSTSVETSASLSTCLLTYTSPSTTAKSSESQSSSLLGSVPEAVSLQTTNTELKTKYAVAIAKVIGLTPYLVEFDQLRSKLKQHPELPLKEKKAHDIMLKNLLTQLKLKVESLKKLTHEFETKYFQHHSTLPQPDNMEYRPLLRQFKVTD